MITLFPGTKGWLMRWNDMALAERLAAEIEGSVEHPAGLCNGTYCPCCARAHQAREDAEKVRRGCRRG
jgi:hypothetical protein